MIMKLQELNVKEQRIVNGGLKYAAPVNDAQGTAVWPVDQPVTVVDDGGEVDNNMFSAMMDRLHNFQW
jgi:hypothetical protein